MAERIVKVTFTAVNQASGTIRQVTADMRMAALAAQALAMAGGMRPNRQAASMEAELRQQAILAAAVAQRMQAARAVRAPVASDWRPMVDELRRAAAAADETGRNVQRAGNEAQGAGTKARAGAKGWSQFAQDLFFTTQGLRSIQQAGQQAFQQLEQGAVSLEIRDAFATQLASAGQSVEEFMALLREASAGTVSDTQLAGTAAKAMSLQVTTSAEEMAQLLEIARFRARRFGIDTAQAFNDISIGIGRLSPLILDNLGFVIGGQRAYEDYARSIGKTAAALTDAEKRQFLLNKIIEQGTREIERAGGITDTTADRYRQFRADLDNARDAWLGFLAVLATSPIGGGRSLIEHAEAAATTAKQLATLDAAVTAAQQHMPGLENAVARMALAFAVLQGDMDRARQIMQAFPGAQAAFEQALRQQGAAHGLLAPAIQQTNRQSEFLIDLQERQAARARNQIAAIDRLTGTALAWANSLWEAARALDEATRPRGLPDFLMDLPNIVEQARKDQRQAAEDNNRKLARIGQQFVDAERNRQEGLADLARGHARQMADIQRQAGRQLADIAREAARRREEIERSHQEQLADVIRDHQRDQAEAAIDFVRDQAKELAGFQRETLRAEEDYQRERQRILQSGQEREIDAIRARDGKALIDARRQTRQQLGELEDRYKTETRRRKEDFEQRQREAQEQYQEERRSREEAFRQRLQDLEDQKREELRRVEDGARRQREELQRNLAFQIEDARIAQARQQQDLQLHYSQTLTKARTELSKFVEENRKAAEETVAIWDWANQNTAFPTPGGPVTSTPDRRPRPAPTPGRGGIPMADGGLFVTDHPLDITIGDAGLEAALFMPLRQAGGSLARALGGGPQVTIQAGAVQLAVPAGLADDSRVLALVQSELHQFAEGLASRLADVG